MAAAHLYLHVLFTCHLSEIDKSPCLTCPPHWAPVNGTASEASQKPGFHAKSLQLSLTLCNPMDCSSPGSSVHGIFQSRILEWVAISFSRGSSQHQDHTASPALAGGLFTGELPGKSTCSFLYPRTGLL